MQASQFRTVCIALNLFPPGNLHIPHFEKENHLQIDFSGDTFVSRRVHIYTVSIMWVCRQNRIPVSPQEKWCRKIKWVTTHHVLQWHGMEVPWHTLDMSPFWDRSSGQSDMQWLRHQWRHCDEAPQNVLHFVACFTSYEPLRKLHINSWWEGAEFPTHEKTEKPRPSALLAVGFSKWLSELPGADGCSISISSKSQPISTQPCQLNHHISTHPYHPPICLIWEPAG